ncbi:MAG: hypothetical protein AAF492_03755 [Verrucomicrobiota bacterium]
MKHRMTYFALLSFLAVGIVAAQEFFIRSISVTPSGTPRITFDSDTNTYYVLYHGSSTDTATNPMAIGVGAPGSHFLDGGVLAASNVFFRILKRSLTTPFDLDGDGMDDACELEHPLLDPLDPSDAEIDSDQDLLTNVQECSHGTDPGNPDTDGDGWGDETEVTAGSNPLDALSRPPVFVLSAPVPTVFHPEPPPSGPPAFYRSKPGVVVMSGFAPGVLSSKPDVVVLNGPGGLIQSEPPVRAEIEN